MRVGILSSEVVPFQKPRTADCRRRASQGNDKTRRDARIILTLYQQIDWSPHRSDCAG